MLRNAACLIVWELIFLIIKFVSKKIAIEFDYAINKINKKNKIKRNRKKLIYNPSSLI